MNEQHDSSQNLADIPAPRPGWLGAWDKFAGPGWSQAENAVLFTATLAAGVFVPVWAAIAGLGWNWLQYILAFFIALDIVGGAVTMAAQPGKRWYHRPGQGAKQHLGFILMHVHPFLVAWLFAPQDQGMLWGYALTGYIYLLLAAPVILFAPVPLKRPLSAAFIAGGCLLNGLVVTPPPGFVWFLPVFYLKLLMSHLVPEKQ